MTARLRPNAFVTVFIRGDTDLGIIVKEDLIDLVKDTVVVVHCSLPVTTEEHRMCHEAVIRVHNRL